MRGQHGGMAAFHPANASLLRSWLLLWAATPQPRTCGGILGALRQLPLLALGLEPGAGGAGPDLVLVLQQVGGLRREADSSAALSEAIRLRHPV